MNFPGTISTFISSRNSRFLGEMSAGDIFSPGSSFLLKVSIDIFSWHRFRERNAFSGSRNFLLVQERPVDSESGKIFAIWHFLLTAHALSFRDVSWRAVTWECTVRASEIEIVAVYFARLRHDAIILMKGSLASRYSIERSTPQSDDYIELSFIVICPVHMRIILT